MELVEDAHPEVLALGFADPEVQDVLAPVQVVSERDVDGVLLRAPLALDVDVHAVHEHERVHGLERAVLPFGQVVHHAVGDVGDHIGADAEPVDALDGVGDVAG